jgi:hypothetical protein
VTSSTPTKFEISLTLAFGKSKKQRHGLGLYFEEVIVFIGLAINSAFGQRNAMVKMSRGRGLRMNGDGGFGLGIIRDNQDLRDRFQTGGISLLGRPTGRPFSPNLPDSNPMKECSA